MDSKEVMSRCPTCGYVLEFAPWEDGAPSDEICPSCGIHFGYDDVAAGDPATRLAVYQRWRVAWVRNGTSWWSRSVAEPPGWDPVLQLIRAGIPRD